MRERCDLEDCVRVWVGEEGNHVGVEKVEGMWTDEVILRTMRARFLPERSYEYGKGEN